MGTTLFRNGTRQGERNGSSMSALERFLSLHARVQIPTRFAASRSEELILQSITNREPVVSKFSVQSLQAPAPLIPRIILLQQNSKVL